MKIPIAKEGCKPIKICLIFSIGFYILGNIFWLFYFFAICSLLATFWLLYFFRDPERKIVIDETQILSPADGKIISIEKTLTGKTIRIFLSPFDVHIQRSPISGKIVSVEYKPGRFLQAFKLDADRINEQNIINLQRTTYDSDLTLCPPDGRWSRGARRGVNLQLTIKQIAGIIARRIICWVHPEDEVIQGERLGMIFLGSQVELQLPENIELNVQINDRVKAGLTVIGKILQ
ncbi:MAG: phosphatidylserine decarboxylase [Elusimicrobiota bacterium]|nr:phosphatidylserine decarboxylase [Elusimicrobiota bacterium]